VIITTSPDITALIFRMEYDLSTVTPTMKIVNLSTGSNLAGCTWWFVVKTPSGTVVHQGSESSVDKTGVWADHSFTETWPQPFGQIEWSGADYSATLYVKDSEDNIFSETHLTGICRPAGSCEANGWNFGEISLVTIMKCQSGKLFVEDKTNYVYKTFTGAVVSKEFKLIYPPDSTGSIPAPYELSGFTHASIPITYSGKYILYADTVKAYTYANGDIVTIKYKKTIDLAVNCDADLCPLICDYQRLITEVNSTNDPAKRRLLDIITAKISVAIIAQVNPACGIDLPALIEEIKTLGGWTCECFPAKGINAAGSVSGGGTISNIQINDTCGQAAGTGTLEDGNLLLELQRIAHVVVAHADATAVGFTITSETEDCVTTHTLNVNLDTLIAAVSACCPSWLILSQHATTQDAKLCPGNPYYAYPVNVYDPTDTTVIGVSQNADETVSIINNNAAWQALGKAFNAGYCEVGFYFLAGTSPVTRVFVDDATTNTPVITPYQAGIKDLCSDAAPTAPLDYPATIQVQYVPAGVKSTLKVLSYADLITKINADPLKPAGLTASAVGNTNQVGLLITNSGIVPSLVKIWHDKLHAVIVGANHHKNNANMQLMNYLNFDTNNQLGTVCGYTGDGHPWHMVHEGGFLYTVNGKGGLLRKVDVSDPMNPVVVNTLQLTGSPFNNLPLYNGGASYYDTLFVQTKVSGDTHLYVLESSTGYFYKIDPVLMTIVDSFQSNKLIGKNPRILTAGTEGPKIYFSRYGDYETGMGLVPTVDLRDIVYLDMSGGFIAAGLNEVQIDEIGDDEPWAMSYNGATGRIIITMKSGSVRLYNPVTDAVDGAMITNVFTPNLVMANTVIWGGYLYVSSFGAGTSRAEITSLATGTGVAFEALPATLNPNNNHYNFIPMPGKCYGFLTFGNESPAGVARFTLDGTFIDIVRPGIDGFYNVIPLVPINPSVTPNTLC
jgi:hypothetical protein